MKRIVCLVFVIFMMFCSVSCNKEQQGDNDAILESKKNASCDDIVSEFISAGYEIFDSYVFSEEELTEIRTEMPNLISVETVQFAREQQLMDVCTVSYLTFSDEQSAIVGYNEMSNELFEGRPTEESGDGYSKSVWRDPNYGETMICLRFGKVVVALMVEYDDYWDAELQYDNKPEQILSEFGY